MIRTTKVYHTDDENFVLVMEDAGNANTTTLTKFLESGPLQEADLLAKIATDIHEFCVYLNDKAGITLATHREHLENEESSATVYYLIKTRLEIQAKALNLETELAPYIDLFWKAMRPFDEPDLKYSGLKQVFVFGDMWPNSILFDRERKLLWVIDWELARFEMATRDLEQLMSMLWLFRQNETAYNTTNIHVLMRKLQLAFFGNESADWRVNCGQFGNVSFMVWVILMATNPDFPFQEDPKAIILKAIGEISDSGKK